MAKGTAISWCDHTLNFWVGCTEVGPACDECYARKWAERAGRGELWQGVRARTGTWGDAQKWHRGHDKWFLVNKRRQRVFTCSLADFFDNHPSITPWRVEAWDEIRRANNLDWFIVTKRIPNVEKMLPPDWGPVFTGDGGFPKPYQHVVLIITVVTQEEANRDVPRLLSLKRNYPWLRVGLSIEPMLGAIDLTKIKPDITTTINALTGSAEHILGDRAKLPALDWVIVGGESGGTVARPMHPAWVRSLRDQCATTETPFHFKQWGAWIQRDVVNISKEHGYFENGQFVRVKKWAEAYERRSTHVVMERQGADNTGRELDGKVYDGFPRAEAA